MFGWWDLKTFMVIFHVRSLSGGTELTLISIVSGRWSYFMFMFPNKAFKVNWWILVLSFYNVKGKTNKAIIMQLFLEMLYSPLIKTRRINIHREIKCSSRYVPIFPFLGFLKGRVDSLSLCSQITTVTGLGDGF